MHSHPPRVAVFGGDARYCRNPVPKLKGYPSGKHGGRGRVRSLLRAIRSRAFDVVLVLVRWVGHAEHDAVRAACLAANVPCCAVAGGWSTARRQLARLGLTVTGGTR